MANINERIGKNGDKQFQAIVRLKGHPTACATFKRKTDAKRWIQETENAIREGRFFKTAEMRRKTLSDALDRYFETVVPKRKEKRKAHVQLGWWREQLGSRLLADITPALLLEYREKLAAEVIDAKTKKIRSASTINKYLFSLSHVFRVAIEEWNWMNENPVQKTSKMKIKNERVRFLSDKEKMALLKACRESQSEYLYIVVLMALTTGARFSEIISLKWSEVDFDRRMIRLLDTKNGENRSVPLVDSVKAELMKLKEVPRIDTDYVFARRDGKKPIELRKHWYIAVKAAKLENFKFHDLRHTAASYLAMSGASPLEIANILGHKTMQMVKRYSHLSEQHTSAVVERMVEKYLH